MLKVLLIVMVVFIHSYSEEVNFLGGSEILSSPEWLQVMKYIISQVIARAAIPLFFLISSFLLYSKDFSWGKNMKKKVKSILIPYLIWNTFWILFFLIAQSIRFTAPYFANPDNYVHNFSAINWLDAYLGMFYRTTPFLYPFWFLRDLFIMNIFAVAIKKLVDKLPILSLAAVGIIWFGGITVPIINNQAIVFFILGYYIVKYQLNVHMLDKISTYLISIIYILFVCLDCTFKDSMPIFHRTAIIIGILFFVKLSSILVNNDLLIKLSEYTFIIYAFHEMNLTILKKLATKVLPQTSIVQLAEYLFIPLIIIVGCILFGYILNKICPKLYKVATGNR